MVLCAYHCQSTPCDVDLVVVSTTACREASNEYEATEQEVEGTDNSRDMNRTHRCPRAWLTAGAFERNGCSVEGGTDYEYANRGMSERMREGNRSRHGAGRLSLRRFRGEISRESGHVDRTGAP